MAAVVAGLVVAIGCTPSLEAPSRPSIVLVVVDTLRADAVSAYGTVSGTTPVIDELANRGVRYAHAYAPSSWTLPSHTSLFTGLGVEQHGVGLRDAKVAPDSLELLAEVLRDAGYETAGFSENPALGPAFGLHQGFETYAAPSIDALVSSRETGVDPTNQGFGLVERVAAWNETRDPERPFFLFINIYDPHYSYQIRSDNPFLPESLTGAEIWYAAREIDHAGSLCDRLPEPREIEILRGLYLGDVAAADAKIGRLLDVLGSPQAESQRVTIVTSDHGEHFGEQRLLAHRFTVHNAALQIPLVVVGPGERTRGVIEQPVDLRGVHRSILCWTGASSCNGALPDRETTRSAAEAVPLVSIFSDEVLTLPPAVAEQMGFAKGYRDPSRDGCSESDGVFGRMVAMLRYPLKLTWQLDRPLRLHDLSWDPGEQTDIADAQTPEANALRRDMARFIEDSKLDQGYRTDPDVHPLDAETAKALEALGYIRGAEATP